MNPSARPAKSILCYGAIILAYVLAVAAVIVGVPAKELIDWARVVFAAFAIVPFLVLLFAAVSLPRDIVSGTLPWVVFVVHVFLVACASLAGLAYKMYREIEP